MSVLFQVVPPMTAVFLSVTLDGLQGEGGEEARGGANEAGVHRPREQGAYKLSAP